MKFVGKRQLVHHAREDDAFLKRLRRALFSHRVSRSSRNRVVFIASDNCIEICVFNSQSRNFEFLPVKAVIPPYRRLSFGFVEKLACCVAHRVVSQTRHGSRSKRALLPDAFSTKWGLLDSVLSSPFRSGS